jgi:hypothetical protein
MANHNTLITIPTSITSSVGDVWTLGSASQQTSGTYDGTSKLVYFLNSSKTIWFDGNQAAYWGDDNPGADPTAVTYDLSSGVVSLSPSSYGSFTSPFYTAASSGGSGGLGGGTVYVQDAKIVNYGGITGFRFEQRGYPAANRYIEQSK